MKKAIHLMAACALLCSLPAQATYYDVETGTLYNNHRDLDTATGRYLESDPLGQWGGSLSPYVYVRANPLKYTDPSGLILNGFAVNGNNVAIDLRINYDTADQGLINFWNQAIASMWSGDFGKWHVTVNVSSNCKCANSNPVHVVPGMPSDGRDWSYFNGGTSLWGANSSAGEVGHEAGHLMGLTGDDGDHYFSNGTPFPGWENNIMANPASGWPDARNIQALVDRYKNNPVTPGKCD